MKPSLVLTDPKREVGPMIARAHRKLGIETKFSNPTGAHLELCPHTNFNAYEGVIDAYWNDDADAYRNTSSFLRNTIACSNPPPPPGAQNKFFDNGGIGSYHGIAAHLIIKQPELSTPSQVFRIASDAEAAREILSKTAEWPESISDPFANDAARAARSILNATKGRNEHHFGDFLKHITDALAAFDETGWLRNEGEFASARISDIRKRRIAVVVMPGLANLKEWGVYISLLANAAFQACKLYPDARPVHFILDEFTSINLPDFDQEMLTLRALGCSAEMYIQSKDGLADRIGEKPARTIYSQSDVKQWTALDTIEDAREISAIVGERSEKEYDASTTDRFEQINFSMRDGAVPLLSPTAAMALGPREQIIKVRGMRAIKAEKVPYWEIAGLRDLIDDNPLEGPAPKPRATAKLKITKRGVKLVWPRRPRWSRKTEGIEPKRAPLFQLRWFAWAFAWAGLWLFHETGGPTSLPALRYQYSYEGSLSAPRYTSCDYIRLDGERFEARFSGCPIVMMIPMES